MKYTLRIAKPEDINDIIALGNEHAEYERAEYNPEGKAEKLAAYLFAENPTLHCLIAESETGIVGYATYMFEFSTWDAEYYVYMDCLYLKDFARSNGIGEALTYLIKSEAKKKGCNLIQWQTPVFNERAIKFYYRIGAVSKEKLRMYLSI